VIGRSHGEMGRFTSHYPVRRDCDRSKRTQFTQGLKTLFCVPTDELLRAKDDLLSEGRQSLNSIFADCFGDWFIGIFLLWEMMLWLSVSVSCMRSSKRRKFRPKMRQNALGGLAPPGPAGRA